VRTGGAWTGTWLFAFIFFVAACSGSVDRLFPPEQPAEIYRPPALAASSTPAQSSPEAALSTPTRVIEVQPTLACVNNLLFSEDLTIPDGTIVSPGSAIDKRWSVENNGNCNWDEGFRLKLVAGSEMGAQVQQALYPARSGTQATIRILFTAPQEPDTYRSAWQAFSPEDEPFGDPIFIEIVVKAPASD